MRQSALAGEGLSEAGADPRAGEEHQLKQEEEGAVPRHSARSVQHKHRPWAAESTVNRRDGPPVLPMEGGRRGAVEGRWRGEEGR